MAFISECAKGKLRLQREEQTKQLAGSLNQFMKPKVISDTTTAMPI